MTFSRSLFVLCPAACLLAQTPAPKPATPAQPGVTLSTSTATARPAPAVPPDKVVLSAGAIKITAAQYEELVKSLPAQYQAQANGPARAAFGENLLHMLVLSEEGKRRKLDETPSYKFQTMFQDANLLASLAYNQIVKETNVDEAELRKYYDAHKADYEQVRARHILIRMQGSPLPAKSGQKDLTEAEALAKVQELRKRIVAGEDFAAVATKESDDTGTAVKGGDLGFFRHNQMVAPFEQAAFSMKPGDLSEPVKTQFGYHLIKVEAKETKSFEDAKTEIENHLRPEQAQKAMQELVKTTGATLDPDFFGQPAQPSNQAAQPAKQ